MPGKQTIFNTGNITCTTNCNYRLAATLYTLHKYDDDDVLVRVKWAQDQFNADIVSLNVKSCMHIYYFTILTFLVCVHLSILSVCK